MNAFFHLLATLALLAAKKIIVSLSRRGKSIFAFLLNANKWKRAINRSILSRRLEIELEGKRERGKEREREREVGIESESKREGGIESKSKRERKERGQRKMEREG